MFQIGRILALGCLLVFASCEEDKSYITLQNSSDKAKTDQPVILTRADLSIDEGYVSLLKDGESVPLQHDDLDGDGQWDEVALVLDFQAGQSLKLELRTVQERPDDDFAARTGVHLGYSAARDGNFQSVTTHDRPSDHVAQSTPFLYQYEGPGWESDLVGFRAYFDTRNGKDIFGKTKPAILMDQVGLEGSYHELHDWGMDVLKVGTSLGAGAVGMLKNDSIYRLTNTASQHFEVLVEGPVRSIIQLDYKGWQVAGKSYDLIEQISIWAGSRGYQNELILKGQVDTDTLVTGIVNLKSLDLQKTKSPGTTIAYTHGKQSENKDVLGMGIVVPEEGFAGYKDAPAKGDGVTNTYAVLLVPTENRYRYAFVAGWELEDKKLKEASAFRAYLENFNTDYSKAIQIKK